MRAKMHRDLVQVSENHVCQARSSPPCSPDGQLTVFNYYYQLPSRPGSHAWPGHCFQMKRPCYVECLPWPWNHSSALVDHLIIDHLCVKSVPFFQVLHGSPLLFLCIDFGLTFFCLLVFVIWWSFWWLMYLPNSGSPGCFILPNYLLSMTQNNWIQKFIIGKDYKCWI